MDEEAPDHVARDPIHADMGYETEVVVDREQLRARLRQERLKRAGPWRPLSGESLTPREFLFLLELGAGQRDYRETVLYLRRAASNKNRPMPDYLKAMFRDGVVAVDMVQGRAGGPISVEYRVPINCLQKGYIRVAQEIVDLRNKKLHQCLDDATLHRLTQFALENNRTIREIIRVSVEALSMQSPEQGL